MKQSILKNPGTFHFNAERFSVPVGPTIGRTN